VTRLGHNVTIGIIAHPRHARRRDRQQCERYLADHPRAKVTTAEKAVRAKIVQLKLQNWLQVGSEGRHLKLIVDPVI